MQGSCSCALRSCMQRVNGSLGNLLNSTWFWSSVAPEEKHGIDWDLRWTNATLTQVRRDTTEQMVLTAQLNAELF